MAHTVKRNTASERIIPQFAVSCRY